MLVTCPKHDPVERVRYDISLGCVQINPVDYAPRNDTVVRKRLQVGCWEPPVVVPVTAAPPDLWTQVSAPRITRGVAWSSELGLFCAVGNGITVNSPTVMTSPTGAVWTARSVPGTVTLALDGICFGNSKFVGVGNGSIITSSDGINWTKETVPMNRSWRGVVWSEEHGQFVACAENVGSDVFATSPDGVTWTMQQSDLSDPDATFRDITYAPELDLYVAIGGGNSNGASAVFTSPDGVTWTTRSINFDPIDLSDSWAAIAWSPALSLFVVVGTNSNTPDGYKGRIMTSPNGVDWTIRNPPPLDALSAQFEGVAWSPEHEVFVLAGTATGTDLAYSFDGITWVDIALSDTGKDWRAICWSPDLDVFCGVGRSGASGFGLVGSYA